MKKLIRAEIEVPEYVIDLSEAKNLGLQALREIKRYVLPDIPDKFTKSSSTGYFQLGSCGDWHGHYYGVTFCIKKGSITKSENLWCKENLGRPVWNVYQGRYYKNDDDTVEEVTSRVKEACSMCNEIASRFNTDRFKLVYRTPVTCRLEDYLEVQDHNYPIEVDGVNYAYGSATLKA